MNILEKLILVASAIAFMVFISLLMAWPVMILWNSALVGTVSGIATIDWMTAWGILLLCSILFKNNFS